MSDEEKTKDCLSPIFNPDPRPLTPGFADPRPQFTDH